MVGGRVIWSTRGPEGAHRLNDVDGEGAIMSFSRKQKILGRSSTEDKIIRVDDTMPNLLWARYFIKAQGYKIRENILHQDTRSAQLP